MKRVLSILLCLMLCIPAAAAFAEESSAVAQGFGGEVRVTVSVQNGKIISVTATGENETPGVGSRAIEQLPKMILAAQSADIDALSGCTVSSNAVLKAAKEAIAAASGTETAAAQVVMTPGTYTGRGAGYGIIGQLALDVTVDETSIVSITVNDPNRETANIFQAAVDLLIPRIVENQSLSVDAVCGATSSSNGIKAAVADALTQALSAAGTDASALDNFYKPIEKNAAAHETINVDVVVVGMGAAGCAAAMSVAEEQAANGTEVSVLAIEQAGLYGGTSSLTGSPMGVNPTEYKTEYNGGEDYVDAEAFRQDWYAYADGDAKTKMIDLFIDNSGDTIDWLVYDHGFWFCQPRKEKETEFRVCMDFVFDGKKEKGYEYPRAFGNRVEAVSSYFDQLVADYTALGGRYMLETKGTGYLTDETGSKVTGVRAIGSDGTEYTINAGAVIIATGGFAANKNMMERYVTEPTGVATSWPIFGYTINDGAMIEAAIDDLNAGVYNIDMVPVSHYNSIASIMKDYPVTIISDKLDSRWNYPRTKSLNDVPMSFAIEPDGLWISAQGKRTVNEAAFHVSWKLGANYWSLWGQDTIDTFRENGFPTVTSTRAFGQGGFDANTPIPEMDEILSKCIDMGTLYKASSVEELAGMIGVDTETLVAVIADYNAACESGVDAMGKDAQYLHPITGENLYAFKCINYTYGTDGGLDVDLDLNVLRTDGSKIEGLYATGYDCSGVLYNSNKSYVDYGGSALGWAFTSGRLAGENAVRYIAE